jgi:hypothetical protein
MAKPGAKRMPSATKKRKRLSGKELGEICAKARVKTDRDYLVQNFRKLPTAMTIVIGTELKTAGDFRQAFQARGIAIGGEADKFLTRISHRDVPEKPLVVELVAISLKDLTGKDEATFAEVLEQAERCASVEPSMRLWADARLQYWTQPMGECLYCGAQVFFGSDGKYYVLTLDNDPTVGKWLAVQPVDVGRAKNPKSRTFSGDTIWLIPRKSKAKHTA